MSADRRVPSDDAQFGPAISRLARPAAASRFAESYHNTVHLAAARC